MEEKILIEAKNLKKYFKVGASSQLHAVDGVNFKIKRGTTPVSYTHLRAHET